MTDTPVTPPTYPPTPIAERVKTFIGDLARPYAIIATSSAATWATIVIANKVTGFEGAALFIAAVFSGVGALFGLKSWEKNTEAKQAGAVEVAKATPAPTVAAPVPDGTTTTTTTILTTPDAGELPPGQRVNR